MHFTNTPESPSCGKVVLLSRLQAEKSQRSQEIRQMHIQSLLAAAFAGVVIIGFLLSSCTPQTEQENAEKMQIPRVSGVIAEQLVQQGALLLDVRTPQEFQQKHLAGAVNLPVNELAERLDEIPTETTIIVYCRSGRRSAKAVGILIDAKRDAKNLGGMTAWPSK